MKRLFRSFSKSARSYMPMQGLSENSVENNHFHKIGKIGNHTTKTVVHFKYTQEPSIALSRGHSTLAISKNSLFFEMDNNKYTQDQLSAEKLVSMAHKFRLWNPKGKSPDSAFFSGYNKASDFSLFKM